MICHTYHLTPSLWVVTYLYQAVVCGEDEAICSLADGEGSHHVGSVGHYHPTVHPKEGLR